MPPTVATRGLLAVGKGLLAVAIGLTVVGALYKPNTDIPAGYPGTHVTVQGIPLRVYQSGSGRELLLIHGSPGSIEDWEPVRAALADSFQITEYDRPGHGFSGDRGRYSFEDNADTALALIDTLHLDHLVVAGHSYGGATTMAIALRHSPKVDAYVVVDSAFYTPARAPDPLYRILDVPWLGMGVGTLVAPLVGPAKIRKGLDALFSGGKAPDAFVTQRIAIWNVPKVTHAIAGETLGAAEALAAQSPRYPTIDRPVFIVAEADMEHRRQEAEKLHRDVPGSSLRLVPGTGHFIQFEKTGEVVDAIREAAASSRVATP